MRRSLKGDDGVALITALLVCLVLLAFGSTAVVLGVNNLRNANGDRQAGSSLGAGDAGVAQLINYIRSGHPVSGFVCPDAAPATCSANPAGYNNPSNPQQVPLDSAGTGCNPGGNNCAKVWVGVVQAFAPPAVKEGIYNIHSEGIYGNGPSARRVVVTIHVTPDSYPVGVFGRTFTGNGGTAIYTESIFSTDCVSPVYTGSGNGTRFTGIDNYWGQPAAAHSTTHISTNNNCGSSGYLGASNPLATAASALSCANNSTLNGDQSGDGGLVSSLLGSACYHTYQRPDGSWYPDGVCPSGVSSPYGNGRCDTTAFTTADLQRYGYQPRGLPDSDYDALRATAQAAGTYNLPVASVSTRLSALVAAGITQPVLYWDCSNAGSVCSSTNPLTLHQSDFPTGVFDTAPVSLPNLCGLNLPIVTIVVEHANFVIQGGNNAWLDAAVFAPDGSVNANGGYQINGTMFANNVSLGGTIAFSLDPCWVKSFPGPILTLRQTGFREDDSTDAP
jgi:hypothetical protein